MDRLPPELIYCIADFLGTSQQNPINPIAYDGNMGFYTKPKVTNSELFIFMRTCRRFYEILHTYWCVSKIQESGVETSLTRATRRNSPKGIEFIAKTAERFSPISDSCWYSCLKKSISYEKYDSFMWLLKKHQENLKLSRRKRSTLLNLAVSGEKRILHILLREADARDVATRRDRCGNTLLTSALQGYKGKNVIRHLLKRGADFSKRAVDGMEIGQIQTVLDVAIEMGRLDAIEIFIKHDGQKVNRLLWKGLGYVWAARTIYENYTYDEDICRLAIMIFDNAPDGGDLAENPFQKHLWGRAVLLNAFANQRWEVAQRLIQHGMGMDYTASYNRSILRSAILYTKDLPDINDDLDGLDFLFNDFLRESLEGAVTVIRMLIDKGARVHVGLVTGTTFLHLVKSTKIARVLLENGVNATVEDSKGNTPLHHSVLNGDINMARLFIRYGADVNYRNFKGQTPLLLAVRDQNISFVHLLLEHGARADMGDLRGNTPRSVALKGFNKAVLERLGLIPL